MSAVIRRPPLPDGAMVSPSLRFHQAIPQSPLTAERVRLPYVIVVSVPTDRLTASGW